MLCKVLVKCVKFVKSVMETLFPATPYVVELREKEREAGRCPAWWQESDTEHLKEIGSIAVVILFGAAFWLFVAYIVYIAVA